MKILKFIESNQNIDKFIYNNNEESIYFPLSALACFELDKKNIKYKIINDYINWNYVNQKGKENYKLVYELLNKCDEICKNELSEIKNYNLRPFFYNYRIFKILIDSIFFIDYVLDAIINKEKPDKIICERIVSKDYEIENHNRSFTYEILEGLNNQYKFGLEFYEINCDFNNKVQKRNWKKTLKLKLLQIREYIYENFQILKLKYLRKNKKIILFINIGYDNKKLFNQLLRDKNFFCIRFRDNYHINKKYNIQKSKINLLKKKIKLIISKYTFVKKYENLLLNYFYYYVDNCLSEIILRYKYNFKKLKKIHPNYIFDSWGGINYKKSIYVKVANDLNIKYCVYQHGGYGPNDNPIIIPHDSWNVNYLLLWGEGTKNYFNDKIEEVKDVFKLEKNAEIVVAGSQILWELKNND